MIGNCEYNTNILDILMYCPQMRFGDIHIACVISAIIKALVYLHSIGIVHRDIKSSNILLKDTGQVKLADFGVAHKVQQESGKMRTMTGSPWYCSPEVITADSYDNKVCCVKLRYCIGDSVTLL
jgi:serine/threonine protein kinase